MCRVKPPKTLLYSSAAILSLAAASPAMAAPQGGVVSGGGATISQAGKKTDIYQSTSKAILDWRSFDIAPDEHTQFHQPSSGAIALNRIHDTKASSIDGKLTANGHVMLINPNGVVFGAGAQVDVGSLTATTADIDNDDFMAGKMDFHKAGASDGWIINEGRITAKEAGLVSLVAPVVENRGIIEAKLGKVQLAAADKFTLDLAGDGLIQVVLSDAQAQKLARNTGRISAEGGTIAMTAAKARTIVDSLVENSGIIEASSMTKQGGKIILGADHGVTKVSGTLKADGKTGGGEILIGGDYQGKGTMANSAKTLVTQEAVITANATDTGDGGKVIVWADQDTYFGGRIEAKGGPNSGNGGFVEVSGKQFLDFRGDADLSGEKLGTLLLDPDDIDIVAGAANPAEFADDSILFAENAGNASTIGADTISGRLTANANVILQANNTIDVDAAITSTGSGNLNLETGSGGTITVNQAIDVNTGDLTLKADEIDLGANLSGSGDIQLTTATATQEIEIGSTNAAALNLTAAELAYLQDGWNSITIGDNAHDSGLSVNEAISFSDDTIIMNGNSVSSWIDINSEIVTTDNSDLTLDGSGQPGGGNPHGYAGVYIDVNLNVANDLNIISGPDFLTGGGATITVGNDFDLVSSNLVSIDTDLYVGGDFNYLGADHHDFILKSNRIIDVEGDIELTKNRLVMNAGSSISANGDIEIKTTAINLDSTSSISGNIDGSSNLTFLEYGENDAMELGGTSAGHNWQMTDAELATIQNNFSKVVFGSSSMVGDISVQSWDLSGTNYDVELYGGAIDLDGVTMGGGDFLAYAGDGQDLTVSADITRAANGDATLDLRADQNILNANDANIIQTDANSDADGDPLTDPDRLEIILNADRDANQSGAIVLTNAAITSNGGDVTMGGGADPLTVAAKASQDGVYDIGVNINNTDITTGAGNISIQGEGEDTGSSNRGVLIHSGSQLQTTSGNITIDGTGGDGDDINYGVDIKDAGTLITTSLGAISITGQGGSDGTAGSTSNYGVVLQNSASITSTGTGVNAGTVTLNGTGGNGDDNNYGVYITDSGTAVSSADGAIDITGQGGSNGLAGSNGNRGITVRNSAAIASTGTGVNAATITLNGTGGGGEDDNAGIYIRDPSVQIISIDGDISLTGVGRTNGVNSIGGNGIDLINGARILSTGTGVDAANITLNGTGNGSGYANGIRMTNGSTFISTVDGDIDLTGQSNGTNDGNVGILMATGSSLSSTGTGANAGTITLNGTGGDGADNNDGIYLQDDTTNITSVDGDISLTGTGGVNATGNGNTGIHFYAGADILSTGTTADAAKITLNGTAGRNSDAFYLNGGSVRSGYGDISITATAEPPIINGQRGLFISNYNSGGAPEAIVESTGTGDDAANITINGTGKNNGVFLHVSSAIKTVDGDINVIANGGGNLGALALRYSSYIQSTGTGANAGTITLSGTSSNMEGVGINGGSYVSSIDGDIDITGVGGDGTALGYGILIGDQDGTSPGYILSQGAANITLDGMAGDCPAGACYGVYMDDAGPDNYIRAEGTGNIDITGRGGNVGSDNYGIFLEGGSYIESTATGADAGTITLNGTGGDGTDANYGVRLSDNGTTITSVDGDIDIMGQGGNGSGNGNSGILVGSQAKVISTGTGVGAAKLTLNGTGGSGVNSNVGVYVTSSGTLLSSIDGDISITGQGAGDGSGNNNHGFIINGGADISSSGTGENAANIIINGTAGAGEDSNLGAFITTTTTFVTSVDGDIRVIGQGGSNGTAGSNDNYGVYLFTGGNPGVLSSGDGDLVFTGTGGAGESLNRGVMLRDATPRATSGNITITGHGQGSGGANDDMYMTASSVLGHAAMTGDITLNLDGFVADANNFVTTQGNLYITPRTASTSIGLGGGAGTLNLSDAELAQITAGGNIVIGDSASGTGAVHIDSVDFTALTNGSVALYGGDMTVDGALAADAALSLIARGDITLNGSLSANGVGNSVTLAGNGFTNNGGAGAINPGAGRWLVYADAPANVIKGGLSGNEKYGITWPQSVPLSFGNGFLYEQSATFLLPDSVLRQMTLPQVQNITVSYADDNGVLQQETRPVLFPSSYDVTVADSSPYADVRLVNGGYLEIAQPIIDFYDLCSYNERYCRH